jgi:pimeloyl-ACP methyl ester carboxylesterase
LLEHLEGGEAASGHAMYADIEQHLVAPMKREFGHGDSEGGVRTFIDYVLQDPHAWDNMDASSHRSTMRDVREWQVMMTTGHLFPDISLQAIRTIQTPTLIVSGAQSYPFLGAIDRELALLIPHNHRVIIAGAGHQMWYQQQEATRRAVDEFLEQ